MKQELRTELLEYYRKSNINLLQELIEAQKAIKAIEQDRLKALEANFELARKLESCEFQRDRCKEYSETIAELLKSENPNMQELRNRTYDFDRDGMDFDDIW